MTYSVIRKLTLPYGTMTWLIVTYLSIKFNNCAVVRERFKQYKEIYFNQHYKKIFLQTKTPKSIGVHFVWNFEGLR